MRTLSYMSVRQGQPRECENLAIMCMDFRFHPEVTITLTHSGYRQFDLVAIQGASKALVDQATRDAALLAIETAINLHETKRVIILDHIDCGAFGGSEAFATPEDEAQAHADSLRQARDIVLGQFPGLEVVMVYTDWSRMGVVE